jgi:hypothetical protein
MGAGRLFSLHGGAMKMFFSTYKFIALVSLIIHEKGLFDNKQEPLPGRNWSGSLLFVTISRMQECTDGSLIRDFG